MGQPMQRELHTVLWRGEPGELKHLSTRRRRKKESIPPVVAIERGSSLNRAAFGPRGVVGPQERFPDRTGSALESRGAAGDTPVRAREGMTCGT